MATSERTPLMPNPQFSVHEKQQAVLTSDSRFRVLNWGRRAGKNITGVMDLVRRVRAPWKWPHGGDDPEEFLVWWLGRSYDQAQKYGYQPFMSAVPDSWVESTKRDKPYVVVLKNGVRVEFRTYAYPDTLQGAGVDDMKVDEAAYMDRSVWDNDLRPMLLDTRGSATFISKPIGRGLFYDCWQKAQSPDHDEWAGFHATSADNPFIDEDPTDNRGDVPERVYKQEYLAEFSDDGGDVFESLDDRFFTLSDFPDEPTPPFAHGWDLARHEDFTVGVVLDADGRLCAFERLQDKAWPQVMKSILDTHDRFHGVVAVDATRDNKIIADVADEGVNVEPVKFTPKRKRNLIENLITRLENEELSAPDIAALRHELEVFTYDVTPSGTVRYQAEEGFHDDAVDALAMAADALETVQQSRQRQRTREQNSGVSYI